MKGIRKAFLMSVKLGKFHRHQKTSKAVQASTLSCVLSAIRFTWALPTKLNAIWSSFFLEIHKLECALHSKIPREKKLDQKERL